MVTCICNKKNTHIQTQSSPLLNKMSSVRLQKTYDTNVVVVVVEFTMSVSSGLRRMSR